MIIPLLKIRTVCLADIATALSGKPVWDFNNCKTRQMNRMKPVISNIKVIYTAWKSQFLRARTIINKALPYRK